MRGFHFYTVAAWVIIGGTIASGVGLFFDNTEAPSLLESFNWIEMIMTAFAAILGIGGLACKAKSMQYEMASRTSIIGYLSVIIMFSTDYFIVGTQFSITDLLGIAIILSATIASAFIVLSRLK
jgi:drug/metabolite transporter (DMT)-like permease